MNTVMPVQRNEKPWIALLVCLAALEALLFGTAMLSLNGGHPMVPLDDSFIHFQYAKQLAHGHAFVFSPGDAYSTGATSLLYPVILAPFFWLGFSGVRIILVSFALGFLTLALSSVVCFLWADRIAGRTAAALAALLLLSNGNLLWVYFSGMETGLFALLMVASLYALYLFHKSPQRRYFSASLVLLALFSITRPEGLPLVIIAFFFFLYMFLKRQISPSRFLWSCLILLPNAIYLFANKILTGSFTTNGMLSKGILFNPYLNFWDKVTKIADSATGIWSGYYQNLMSYLPYAQFREKLFFPYFAPFCLLMFAFGLFPLVASEIRKRALGIFTLAFLWYFLGLLATTIAAPDFSHSQRYHLPYQPLFFVFVSAGVVQIASLWKERAKEVALGIAVFLVALSIPSIFYWAAEYGENCNDIYNQHRRISWWVSEKTPPDCVIGTTDVGLITYYTDRPIYDFVGLVTNNEALHWLNGIGSTWERMEHLPPNRLPRYIITYSYLWGTDHFLGDKVYQVSLSKNTVTSGKTLEVFKPDWSLLKSGVQMQSDHSNANTFGVVDSLDIADLQSEQRHSYKFTEDAERRPYLPWPYRGNLFRNLAYNTGKENPVRVCDGGRAITGFEQFRIRTTPNKPLKIVCRTDAAWDVSLNVVINHSPCETWHIPATYDAWQEAEITIPAHLINSETTTVRLEYVWNHVSETAHRSFYYWFLQPREK
jgi:hypothetical protein